MANQYDSTMQTVHCVCCGETYHGCNCTNGPTQSYRAFLRRKLDGCHRSADYTAEELDDIKNELSMVG